LVYLRVTQPLEQNVNFVVIDGKCGNSDEVS